MNNWYTINAKANKGIDVEIFDEIGVWGVSAESFIQEVQAAKPSSINVRINSPGGSVFDAFGIFNFLKSFKGHVTATIEGMAASAATVIALAADEVVIHEPSVFMIHNAWSMGVGDHNALQKEADVLEKISGEIAQVYSKATGIELDTIKTMMDEETWMTASEAVEMGFANTLIEGLRVAACIKDLEIPERIQNYINNKNTNMDIKVGLKDAIKGSVEVTEEVMNSLNGEMQEMYASIKEELSEAVNAKSDLEATVAEQKEALEKFASIEEQVETAKSDLEAKEAEVAELEAKVVELEGTPATPPVDPIPEGQPDPQNKANFFDTKADYNSKLDAKMKANLEKQQAARRK